MNVNFLTDKKPKCKCGKVIFDKRGAQTRKNELEKIGREKKLWIYQCPLSNMWHLTSKHHEE